AFYPRARPDRRPPGLRKNAGASRRALRPAHRLELSGAGPEAEQAFSGVASRTRCGILHAAAQSRDRLHLSRWERSTRIVRCEAGEGYGLSIVRAPLTGIASFDAIRPLPCGER